ncbi:MAG: YidC/Oxa1 family membrane protein insertase [Candidatus Kerfeldbacteria bacterium]
MSAFFNEVFYRPIFNALIALYHYLPVHDIGLAIIAVTIATLVVLFWPSLVQIKSSQALQELQPKLKALQVKYKDDRQELAKQTMLLYKEHKFNPLSSCLPLLIQLPFFFALYRVFISGLSVDPTTHILDPKQLPNLYGHLRDIYATAALSPISFGFINLTAKHNIILALIVGATQYFLTKLLAPKKSAPNVPGAKDERTTSSILQQMNYFTPISFAVISYILPAGLSLYYITWNIFQILQRQWVARKHTSSIKESQSIQ